MEISQRWLHPREWAEEIAILAVLTGVVWYVTPFGIVESLFRSSLALIAIVLLLLAWAILPKFTPGPANRKSDVEESMEKSEWVDCVECGGPTLQIDDSPLRIHSDYCDGCLINGEDRDD